MNKLRVKYLYISKLKISNHHKTQLEHKIVSIISLEEARLALVFTILQVLT